MNEDIKVLTEALQACPPDGDWRVARGACSVAKREVKDARGFVVAWCRGITDSEAHSVAQYIAACSPLRIRRLLEVNAALLKAVQLYLEWIEAEEDHSKADFYERMEMCRQADQAARAAIARALGQ